MVQRKSPYLARVYPVNWQIAPAKTTVSEIFLVEETRQAVQQQGRDRMFQAILPLRGKILNVEKAMPHKVLESDEIKNIYTALGVSIGTEED